MSVNNLSNDGRATQYLQEIGGLKYDALIIQYFYRFRDELLFCIHQLVDPSEIDEFLLSSLKYSKYGFELERLFERDTNWSSPYVTAIKSLQNVGAVLLDDNTIATHKEIYKQSSSFSKFLNLDANENESGYIEKQIIINSNVYNVYYNRSTAWDLYYHIKHEWVQYCLNDYQYMQLAKHIAKDEWALVNIENSGDLLPLDKKNTPMSIQKWIYTILMRHYAENNIEIAQMLWTYWVNSN